MSQPEVLDQNSPMVVTFMTTEHFVLQTARSAGITETVGRAAIHLAAVSGGLVALFIARPGGNAATAVAFSGYVALAANGTIKGGAILMTVNARRRTTSGPVLA